MVASSDADSWPPGGADPLIDDLACDYRVETGNPDISGLLNDPRLGKVAIVSSFGADSVALLHYISRIRKDWPVLFLETGKHFSETLEYVKTVATSLNLYVEHIRPDTVTLQEDDPSGDLWTHSPDYCCMIRKQFPIQDALAEYDTWISGRKRFQSATRQALPLIERDGEHLKINPLAFWAPDEIRNYMLTYRLPKHPLVERGFPSIGCAPCTKSVAPGDDPRSGRWSHMPDKTECGIHLGPDGKFRRG